MKDSKKNIVVVLGMHRSGTSTITRGISLLGVELGNNLHPPGEDNPKGFWEDKDCLRINESLLEHLGSAYDRLGLTPEVLETLNHADAAGSLKLEAVEVLRTKFLNTARFGFKDPRVSRLLPFWKNIFKAVGCTPRYVIAVRNPISVARSLSKRNRIEPEKSYFLWLEHVVSAVLDSSGSPRVMVDYDIFLESPQTELQRIADVLNLDPPAENLTALKEFAKDFLEAKLRHTHFQIKDLELDPKLPKDVSRAYELALNLANGEMTFDDPVIQEKFFGIRQRLHDYAPAFGYVNILEDRIIGFYQNIAERTEKIEKLTDTLSKEKSNTAKEKSNTEDLSRKLLQITGQRDCLEKQYETEREKTRKLGIQLEQSRNQARTEREKLEQVNRQLAVILNSNSWRLTSSLRFFRKNLMTRPYPFFRTKLSRIAHWGWESPLLPPQGKQKFKNSIFKRLPFLFRRTEAYRRWQNLNDGILNTAIPQITSMSGQGRSCYKDNISSDYVPMLTASPPRSKSVKLICFYLPQFHSIPENDEWWGKGFTEWANVKPAKPQFVGHHQPHVPGELGYYNLLDAAVQHRQVELAKLYGIGGFCFYFYWFGGKRLLETPIKNYLANKRFDLPFCLCWANENWTRRWDGLENEILIAQQHSPEDDLAFIQHVARYMKDPRYIRINGKPLLLVYRPSLLPSAKKTAQRWRNWCTQNGIGDLFLAYTQSFEKVDPSKYGFDAAVEFPPNNSAPPDVTGSVTPIDKNFGCTIYDWQVFVERSKKYQHPGYKIFRSVCPGWDNTARRNNRSTVFINNTPKLYRAWLENAIQDTVLQSAADDERLIFVNAWNEWAEGAHLEPDARYGYAYLQATRDALTEGAETRNDAILLVTHDAHPHGAQFLLLSLARQLRIDGFRVAVLALKGGRLLDEFSRIGQTLNAELAGPKAVHSFLYELRAGGMHDAVTSTVVSGSILPLLKDLDFRVLSLIHELPGIIRDMHQETNADTISRLADKIVFPAELVHQRFREIAPVEPEKVLIRHQGLLRRNPYRNRRLEARREILQKHRLPKDSQIVLSIAYADARKGADLFVEIAAQVLPKHPNAVFIWVGHGEPEMMQKVESRINALELQGKVLFVGFDREPMAYYAAASVYALPSREDPFPNVVLEATEAGIPVVAFDETTGAGRYIIEQGGRLADFPDPKDFARKISELLSVTDRTIRHRPGSMRQYALDLLHHLNDFPRVSVIVPNYNYERHIIERLESIRRQTFPIYELVVLDDASTDRSCEVITKYLSEIDIDARLFVNEKNSGSVFRQWCKGIKLCRGEVLWIAEADDLSNDSFLDELVPAFHMPETVLAFSQSKQMNTKGKIIKDHYLEYTREVSDKWGADYTRDGREEIREALCIKNTLPNVSAVLFRRKALDHALNTIGSELFEYQIAGDWLVYLHVMMQGKVCYIQKPLNLHRRHAFSVTGSAAKHRHLQEVRRLQEIAQSLVEPTREARAKSRAYIEYLRKYFGLPDEKQEGLRDDSTYIV
ncbi:glycoside hydrolase family 99-like domain-containing protein [Desulfococcus multivorans]|uniref:Glycosyl transferase group 1 n=1 Tax=Desulfococcus multivorans DSM 2059 TaxID=1121405 RepID=S7TRK4_DESML|nr:glycoside hydrolase family 99-like domain-containing protein [Desulfococcus multivorans]AOY57518.1 putative glycosyl transferase, family 1 [Desulfococcus multivorans]AQV02855.2 hypothetical protein B2D07_03560 [Desulfococcus multivorans]EPR39305.1 glycosyl transferase group 1 [Desulfococcus multivorans DSM 2059]SKA12456.1 hypothetical protein SAMN02745446_02867 [Desulfococcus multivorans DSM 2059]